MTWWFGMMALGGLAFGLFAEGRPFGQGFFAYPLVAFFIAVAAGLLLLRLALGRPVPDMIPERLLIFGCFVGLAMFLIGNYAGVHLLAGR